MGAENHEASRAAAGERDPWVGRLLAGRYRLGRVLGRGGIGAVYEATQEGLGRTVAVKILHPHLCEDELLVRRLRREAETTAALAHPNIVQVTDLQHTPGEIAFLVMEHLSGQSLADCVESEGALAPERAAFIAVQTLSALEAAHGAGVIHRDLKPGNLFLTSISGIGDIVKVLDFGIAKLTGGDGTKLTASGAVLGTPAFMSPEQARGDEVDARSDIYAIGATLYFMLTGKPPFEGRNITAVLIAVLQDDPHPLADRRPDLDPELVAVVERAMAKEADRRYPDAAAMVAALAAFARPRAGAPAATPRIDPHAPTEILPAARAQARAAKTVVRPAASPRSVRIWGWVAGSIAALAAGVLLLVWAPWRGDPPRRTGGPPPSSSPSSSSGTNGVDAPVTPARDASPRADLRDAAPPADAGPAVVAVARDAGAARRGHSAPRSPASARPAPRRPPVPPRPRFRRTVWLQGSGSDSCYDLTYAGTMAKLGMAAIQRCFARSKGTPFTGQGVSIYLHFDAAGRIQRATDSRPRLPGVAPCVGRALGQLAWKKTPYGKACQIRYFFRVKDRPL